MNAVAAFHQELPMMNDPRKGGIFFF